MVDGLSLWSGARTVVTRLAMIGYDDVKTRGDKARGRLRCCLPYAGPLHAHGRYERPSFLFENVSLIGPEPSPLQVVVLETLSPDPMLADLYDTADDE
jgi:hypothetical protein